MSKYIVIVALALSTIGCTTATTGKKLADVAQPQPKSSAEAFRECVGHDINNSEIIAACKALIISSDDRAKSTADSAAKAAQPSFIYTNSVNGNIPAGATPAQMRAYVTGYGY